MVSLPRSLSSPRSTPHQIESTASHVSNSITGKESITNNGYDYRNDIVGSPSHHGDRKLMLSYNDDEIGREKMHQSSKSSSSALKIDSSPLKVAASLIQSLDLAHTEMTRFAADAAADAERARRNARAAQEIARRYQHRSNSTFETNGFESCTPATESSTSTASSATLIVASCPKLPEVMKYPNISSIPGLTKKFKRQNGEEKDNEVEINKQSKNDVGDENAGVYVSTPVNSKKFSIQDISSKDVQNRRFQASTSFERIAQHHADDVLQLTLELERIRQALKSEQRLHEACRSSLASTKSKKAKLESIHQKLSDNYDIEQKQSSRQICHLEQELEVSRLRLQAAEEDAQLALDLAKDSAEQRDRIEENLLKSQEDIKTLREQQDMNLLSLNAESPKRNVHFAVTDDDKNTSTASAQFKENESLEFNTQRRSYPPRSMIAAGRQLLLRRNMSPKDAVTRLEVSPSKSAEKRQQLCRRLNKHLNECSNETTNNTLLSSPKKNLSLTFGGYTIESGETSLPSSLNSSIMKKKLGEYQTALQILQMSGKRLELDGYWWREQGKEKTMPVTDSTQIDIVTRQYCQNVELKISRQETDIIQLESLCGYLEKNFFGGKSDVS